MALDWAVPTKEEEENKTSTSPPDIFLFTRDYIYEFIVISKHNYTWLEIQN